MNELVPVERTRTDRPKGDAMKTPKIEAELKNLEKRREALATEEQNARLTLEAARRALIERPTESAAVTSAQSTHTALSDALASVDEELARLRSALSDAQASEARELKITRLVELAAAGSQAFTSYQAACAEADAALLAMAERLQAGQMNVERQRRQFLELFTEFCPHAALLAGWSNRDLERGRAEDAEAARLLGEVRRRGADLAAVTSALFGPSSQLDTSELHQRTVTDEPLVFVGVFRQLIDTAEQHARQNAATSEPSQIRVTGRGDLNRGRVTSAWG